MEKEEPGFTAFISMLILYLISVVVAVYKIMRFWYDNWGWSESIAVASLIAMVIIFTAFVKATMHP